MCIFVPEYFDNGLHNTPIRPPSECRLCRIRAFILSNRGGNNRLTTNQLAIYKPAVGVPRERLQQAFSCADFPNMNN